MDARRYECIKALISGALALPIEQRLEYLRREGGGDDELIREAIDLLAHDCGHDAEPADSSSDSESLHSLVGQTIAGYQLIRVIGAGGMGVVFLAEQTQPLTRRVALKVIKIGMDTREVVARFDSERRALAMMNHPNIARVLDAGATESGRPYFAMEYIAGAPIIHFCQEQELDLEARIRLFIQVCRGIHHAHQRGIIHRDIKPGNILVTLEDDAPVAKVIDFGVAKAINQRLTEQTVYTHQGHILGTPEYMSPEQADLQEHDIDTRCDVYSLGVLLYEMMTGSLPISKEEFRQAGFAQMPQLILDHEPVPPSRRLIRRLKQVDDEPGTLPPASKTWCARLKRDLDWVTMKAIEKDRERRYDSPGALAEDLTRFLADRPVDAGPPSRLYRIRRFVRRYRIAVATTMVVVLSLLLGIVGTTTGMIRADRAEEEARQAVRRSEAGRLFELARNEKLIHRAQAMLLRAIELDDRPEYRRRVRRNLLLEPPMHRLPVVPDSHNPKALNFSPDGRYLAVGWSRGGSLQLFPLFGGQPRLLEGHDGFIGILAFTNDSRRLVTVAGDATLRIWDPKTGQRLDRWTLEGELYPFLCRDDSLLVVGEKLATGPVRWWSRPLLDSRALHLGTIDNPQPSTVSTPFPAVDPGGRWLVQPQADRLLLYDLEDLGAGPVREFGSHPRRIAGAVAGPGAEQVLSYDAEGLARIWNLHGDGTDPVRTLQSGPNPYYLRFSRDRRRLMTSSTDGVHVWDLTQSTAARPMVLQATSSWTFDAEFHPSLPWLVTTQASRMTSAWSLDGWSRIDLELPDGEAAAMRFSEDGRTLITASDTGVVTLWPLDGTRVGEPHHLGTFPGYRFAEVLLDAAGDACYLVPCNGYEGMGTLIRLPITGGTTRSWTGATCSLDISEDGRYAAVDSDEGLGVHQTRVFDLQADATVDLESPDGGATTVVGFVEDGRLLAAGPAGLGLWTPDGTGFERLDDTPIWAGLAGNRRTCVSLNQDGNLWRWDLTDGSRETLATPPELTRANEHELDESGSRMVMSLAGEDLVFVDLDQEFVHRLPIAAGLLESIAIDPVGRWIAASHDGMVTLLAIPDAPPPEILPHEEYVAWLRSLTNLRLVEDDQADTGYRIEGQGVPDWQHPPRW